VNLELAKAEVSGSRAQLSQATAAQRLAETNLACTRILSPIDGVVISKSVDVGQTVAASFQTPTLFKIAQDLTRMQIDTNVDEADIGSVAVGQEVEFTVDAYPEVDFRGSVRQVRNDPVTVQNVVTYDAVIDVDNPELKLKPGMTANVSIITTEKTDVLRVANAALRYRPAETGDGARDPSRQKGYGVWVLEEGAPKHVPLSLGVSDGVYTEVVAGDLSEGEELIVSTVEKPASGRRKPALRLF
jgi:HlyD family secretion protein